jgi:putative ABC transport system ATP-binding protein
MVMSTAPSEKILQLKGVTKTFARGTVDEVTALNNINLEISDQDFISIIGSNGAGKSTLLNIIAGLYPPDSKGRVIIRGVNVTKQTGYRRAAYVGRVWQQPEVGTAGKLTIEENLSLAVQRGQTRGLKGAISKARRDLFREELVVLGLGLEDRLKTPVSTLSGGQRQALALIMATISKPSILLLDEHIATLDPKTARTVLELTDKIVLREKMTTVMVTHNMEIALHHGNRLIMMHKGRIIVDKSEAEKKALQVSDLVAAFERAAGEEFDDDSILLSGTECD